MRITKDFAEYIRHQLDRDPELKRQVEDEMLLTFNQAIAAVSVQLRQAGIKENVDWCWMRKDKRTHVFCDADHATWVRDAFASAGETCLIHFVEKEYDCD